MDVKDIAEQAYKNGYEKACAEYEQKLEDGELVSKDWHDEQVGHLLAEIDGYKADQEIWVNGYQGSQVEIERLKAENEELKQTKFGNWKVKFFKAQEEIERLTKESDEMFDRHAKENQAASILIEQRNNEIAELKKQVDELTDKLGNVLLGIKADELLVAKGIEQAVKDTAKQYKDFMILSIAEMFKYCEIDEEQRDMLYQHNYQVYQVFESANSNAEEVE